MALRICRTLVLFFVRFPGDAAAIVTLFLDRLHYDGFIRSSYSFLIPLIKLLEQLADFWLFHVCLPNHTFGGNSLIDFGRQSLRKSSFLDFSEIG